MPNFKILVALADDHPGMIAGIEHELAKVSTIKIIASARNSSELIRILDSTKCDVVVSDYAMPSGDLVDGIAFFEIVQRRHPHLKIVILTMLDSPNIVHGLLAINVNCIVSKSDAVTHLVPAIHAAYTGGKYCSPSIDSLINIINTNAIDKSPSMLTQRELEVVRMYASGLGVNQIADRLHRSNKTISTQKTKAMLKLGIERDIDLLRYAIENGLVPPSGTIKKLEH